ncbi:SPOR domain-containing protein [Magnetospirillum sp. SS-4]|uniref:SPOR domain-containing protein n=1 Tax=Magnetospirillum sp. SS-4 TaxID=2681465 RepID=UPI0020C46F51|nr:SPOR domain-containing protein [Magnetospirillum sp. SS-4]
MSGCIIGRSLGLALLAGLAACGPAPDPRQTIRDGLFYDGLAAFHEGYHKEAASRWERAAHFGDMDAARNLGHLYRQGLGVERDSHAALAWYRMAADADMPAAQYNLGMLYLNGGPDLPADRDQGLVWLTRAAEAGLKPARDELERQAVAAVSPPVLSPPVPPPSGPEAPIAYVDPPVTVRAQVGSYLSRHDAETDIRRLRRPGFEFEIVPVRFRDGKLWYRLILTGEAEAVDRYCREAEKRRIGCWPGGK